jgi:glycosyltransferase involved in cell wall biosynthesis
MVHWKGDTGVKIALVHYHLRRGGVTSVLYHQAEVLRAAGEEVLIIAGEAPPEDRGFSFALAERLAYYRPEDTGTIPDAAEGLARDLVAAMEHHWGKTADIIHVHNPLILKNILLIPALQFLALRGCTLLLQNHDLAEDFRPDVYAAKWEYPENCHYAVINHRDYSYLRRAGLKEEGLHLIPNEVAPVAAAPGLARTRYLYPVRGIRRKNVGEALLVSLFIPKGRTVAITLPPIGKEGGVYKRWTETAAALGLPVEFDLGLSLSLPELFGSAFCALSTSVKEGFGFSFLEPWTADRALFGRRIDCVCGDFEEAGLRFDALYRDIKIPLVYISPGALRAKMEKAVRGVYESFGAGISARVLRMIDDDLSSGETVDFGRLDEEFQIAVIGIMAKNPAVLRDVASMNPFLRDLADWEPDGELIRSNGEVVRLMYGRERMAKILLDAYRKVLDHQVIQRISKPLLLDLYLEPLHFSLVGLGSG